MMQRFGTPGAEGRVPRGHDHRARSASASGSPSRTTAATPPGSRRRAVRDGDDWVINGEKRFNIGPAQRDTATSSSRARRASPATRAGITCFLVPTDAPGFKVELHVVDLQHADRPRRGGARRTCACPTSAILGEEGEGLAARAAPSCTRTASARRPRASAPRSTASTRACAYAQRAQRLRQAALAQPGDPVPARRAAHRVRDGAQPRLQDRLAARPRAPHGRDRQGLDVQLPREPARAATPPTWRSRCTAASATRATSPSSTSTATTAATASPRAPRRSRCAASPACCSGARRSARPSAPVHEDLGDRRVRQRGGEHRRVPRERALVRRAGGGGLALERPHPGDRPALHRPGDPASLAGHRRPEAVRPRAGDGGLGAEPRRRRALHAGAPGRDPRRARGRRHAGPRGLRGAPPRVLPRALDRPRRLVPRLEAPRGAPGPGAQRGPRAPRPPRGGRPDGPARGRPRALHLPRLRPAPAHRATASPRWWRTSGGRKGAASRSSTPCSTRPPSSSSATSGSAASSTAGPAS